jgi:hypothetical protein
MKSRPCVAASFSPCFGPIQVAHTENGGMGRKADAQHTTELCASHHADFDQHRAPFDQPNVRAFVKLAAAQTQAEWDLAVQRRALGVAAQQQRSAPDD